MDNKRIKVALATLPYREMRELGKDMSAAMKLASRHEDFSEALANLIDVEASQEATGEQEILASCFNRKKTFSIQPYNDGFKITCVAMEATIFTSNIRAGLSELLDHIVTLKVLE